MEGKKQFRYSPASSAKFAMEDEEKEMAHSNAR